MKYISFEKKLMDEIVDRTGRRVSRKDIIVWSTSKSWVESMENEYEKAIFLPQLSVWCLVRFAGENVKNSDPKTLKNSAVAA